MAWHKWFWIGLYFSSVLIIVGCTSPQKQADSPLTAENAVPNDLEITATPEVKLPPTEPATEEIEVTATAVPSATATTTVEPTIQQSAGNANADVLYVLAKQESKNTWKFTVTVEHPDSGWEDYADGWDVVLPDGSVARPDSDTPFTRLLLHPHETEQPFTRSQGGIEITPGITEVTVRAHDIVDGFGGREVTIDLTENGGPDYEVQRLQE